MDERARTFGYWLRRRRKALDLTQEQLARSVHCSGFAIRKIEADERRPSRALAERLAEKLGVAAADRPAFLQAARAERTAASLELPAEPLPTESKGSAFVGRAGEFGRLLGLLARLTAGAGHVALIEGEPGIGKSRLMEELASYAKARGLRTLATRCYEIERGMPYQPVAELANQAVELAGAAALQTMSPVALAEIAALVPSLAERAEVPQLSSDFPEARQVRLFRAMVQLLDALAASRQLVVMVDDIQWADDASAQFLHFLGRQAARRPLLLACAYRDEELDADERLPALVASLRREPHARHLRLARLDLAATQALMDGFGDADLAARLHRETEGNPFFLTSMLQALRDGEIAPGADGDLPLPDALRAAVRARLSHLPPEARSALEVAAVLGRHFDFDSLVEVANEPEERLLGALDVLVKRRLLREEAPDGLYDFSHDKVREVAYLEVGAARRLLLHRAVAEALERAGESEAQIAEHFSRARVWTQALDFMVRAGERSQKLFAMREALHWLDRAVELAEAHPEALGARSLVELYGRRGDARAQAGHTEGAVADIRRVLHDARRRGERAKVRDTLILLGMTHRRGDDYGNAVACLNEALAESRAMGDERHAADTLYHLGTVAWSDGRNREAIAFHSEAVEICERLAITDLVAVQAYHGRGEAHFFNLEPQAAIACYERSIELARGIGDKSYECENLMMIGYACIGYMGLADYPRASAALERALEMARHADLQWHMGPLLLGLDHVRACAGSYAEAWAGMNRTLRWLERLRQVRYQLMAYDFMGHLLLELERYDEATTLMERGLALARGVGIAFWRPRIETNLAIAAIRLGRRDVGPQLEEILRYTRENGDGTEMLRCLEALAELALARGDPARCLTHADELLGGAQAGGLREMAASARRWRGEAYAARGERAAAISELRATLHEAEAIGRPRLALDAARALERLGEPTDAMIQALTDRIRGQSPKS